MSNPLERLTPVWRDRVEEAVVFLGRRGFQGRVGLVLGSGLGSFVEAISDTEVVAYADIPGFKATSVAEHTGRLVCGQAAGVQVVVMQGRLHPYEGLDWADLLLPTAVLACLGVEVAVVTNAAGGLNRYYRPADLMVIRDQLDLHFRDPLKGLVRSTVGVGRGGGVSHLFSVTLADQLVEAAAACGVPMHVGTYASMYGPGYETKAEIAMLRRFGCDAVGMSTAPETVLLKSLGVSPVGLSCITNPARETGQPELSHADVVQVGQMVRERMTRLLLNFLPRVGKPGGEAY